MYLTAAGVLLLNTWVFFIFLSHKEYSSFLIIVYYCYYLPSLMYITWHDLFTFNKPSYQ